MINYTECITTLMHDIVSRVPALSFIDVADVLVFARSGRSNAEGAFATCHCLTLPASEPGYYFWRDRRSGKVTRRSDWFVTKSPEVMVGSRQIKYLISMTVPRFCDQSLERSRKGRFYCASDPGWIAKLDTVVHELFHIDPDLQGIRRLQRPDGSYSTNCHSQEFFREVERMVREYIDSRPDPAVYEFLQADFTGLESRYNGVVGTSFRTFPSYPQRFIERLQEQPAWEADLADVNVQPLRFGQQATRFTDEDLHVRQFCRDSSRRLVRKGQFRAA
jgi:hypothetical protein